MLNFTNLKVESPRIKRIVKQDNEYCQPLAIDILNTDDKSLNLSFNSFLSSIKNEIMRKGKSFELSTKKLIIKLKLPEAKEEKKENIAKYKKMQTFNNLTTINPLLIQSNDIKFKTSAAAVNNFLKIDEEFETNDITDFLPKNDVDGKLNRNHVNIINSVQVNVNDKSDMNNKSDKKIDEWNVSIPMISKNRPWDETDFDYKMEENLKTHHKMSNYCHNNDIVKMNALNKKWVDNNKDLTFQNDLLYDNG